MSDKGNRHVKLVVNANILLRFLTKDDSEKAARCKKLLEDAAEGNVSLEIATISIMEVVWVLESVYNWPKSEIAACLPSILYLPGCEIRERDELKEAFGIYAQYNIDFIDAYHVAYMRSHKLDKICSYDTHFDRISDVKRIEP